MWKEKLLVMSVLILMCRVSSLNFSVDVCALCKSFGQTFKDEGVNGQNFADCSLDECLKSSKFNLILHEMRTMFNEVTVSGSLVNVSNIDHNQMAEFVIHNIIGKQFVETEHDKEGPFYFRYDLSKSKLVLNFPLCTFEKQIYSVLLILTVITLLAALALKTIRQKKKPQ